MNGILLSFIFSIIIFSIYWFFVYIKEKFNKVEENGFSNIQNFYTKLNNYTTDVKAEYFEVVDFLNTIPNITKVKKSNKELFYLNDKLVVKIVLRDDNIMYFYKKNLKKKSQTLNV